MKEKIDTIIFDLGGVLIDWNPKYLYRKLFRTELAVDHFLDNITTHDWNEQQDAGRSLELATKILVEKHPHYQPEIEAFYGRWEEEMLGGPIQGSVDILKKFIDHAEFRVFALTNWSAETFPFAQQKFDFLQWFEGILVSGEEKMKKPDEKIYHLLLERFNIIPERSLFIDDSLRNVQGARNMGINAIQFKDAKELEKTLNTMSLLD